MSLPSLETTAIPGLLVVRLDRRDDDRGFFKENWQREKMLAIGMPDFGPVQNNVSFNADRGVTRGIHTEPWDKLVSLATGRIFGAWVDMRQGETFGTTVTLEMDTSVAVFVPPLAYLAIPGFVLLILGARRREGQKYAGLRILR